MVDMVDFPCRFVNIHYGISVQCIDQDGFRIGIVHEFKLKPYQKDQIEIWEWTSGQQKPMILHSLGVCFQDVVFIMLMCIPKNDQMIQEFMAKVKPRNVASHFTKGA